MRLNLPTVLTGFLTGLLVLSASPAAAGPAPAQSDVLGEDVIGEGASDSDTTQGGTAKVNALDQTDNGFTSLAWTLVNEGTETITLRANVVGDTYLYNGQPFSGITILDESEQNRYHPLMDEDGGCLCSGGEGSPPEFVTVVGGNRHATYSSMFQLPEEVDAVTVEIPGFEPIEDVPVG